MRVLLLTSILSLLWLAPASAEVMFQTPHRSQATLKVFVVSAKAHAEMCVFITRFRSQAVSPYIWFYTPYRSQATQRVFFAKSRSDAHRTVYFVRNLGEAGPCHP